MNCMIIDDEPLAREGLAGYVQKIDFLTLHATAEDPLEALPELEAGRVGLLFLDIQMPGMNGLDFLRTLDKPPLTIITTAYPSFALDGYELEVLDYLVKPITFQRFLKAALKARRHFQLLQEAGRTGSGQQHIFVKCEGRIEKVALVDLLFAESMENYVQLYTHRRRLTTLLTMKTLAEELPCPPFYRVHRSYLANLQQVQALEGNLLHIGEHRVPVSRQHAEKIRQTLDRKSVV